MPEKSRLGDFDDLAEAKTWDMYGIDPKISRGPWY